MLELARVKTNIGFAVCFCAIKEVYNFSTETLGRTTHVVSLGHRILCDQQYLVAALLAFCTRIVSRQGSRSRSHACLCICGFILTYLSAPEIIFFW